MKRLPTRYQYRQKNKAKHEHDKRLLQQVLDLPKDHRLVFIKRLGLKPGNLVRMIDRGGCFTTYIRSLLHLFLDSPQIGQPMPEPDLPIDSASPDSLLDEWGLEEY